MIKMLKVREVDLKEYTDFVDTQSGMTFFANFDTLEEFENFNYVINGFNRERTEKLTHATQGEAIKILLLDNIFSVFSGVLK